MKKVCLLIFKCICVLFPIIFLCIHCATSMMSFVDDEAPYYLWNKKQTEQTHDDKVHVIVLGDSTANAAYMPEVLSGDTLNLSLGGTTSIENYYVMKEWLETNPEPEAVYISFMDFHMSYSDSFWSRTMYSHRFPPQINMEILRAAVKYDEASILVDGWFSKFISYELYLPNMYITPLINASLNQRYDGNMAVYQGDELHGGRYIGRGNGEYVPSDAIVYNSFYVAPILDFYYRELIELCQDNGIRVHLIKLPLPDNSEFTEEYVNQFWTYCNNLLESYPEITVDWFPGYAPSNFVDTHHMNTHGAFQFSRELRELYPDDFNNQDMTERRITAINENMIEENRIEELYLWAMLGDWTLVSSETENGVNLQVIDNYNNIIVLERDL